MQLVVLRTLYDPQNPANNQCCIAEARSSRFTPVANAITTLAVALPVGAELRPTAGVEYVDQLGLSILEDGVTIPVVDLTNLPFYSQPVDEYEQPAMTLGQRRLASGPSGYMLDMQATWYPPGQTPATLTLPAKPVKVTRGNAMVALDCTLAPCTGTVRLQNLAAAGPGKGRRTKLVTYARGSFSLAAGESRRVAVRLTGAGRALAADRKRMRVFIVATVSQGLTTTISRAARVRF
jgi:hypothetical protein